MGWLFKRKVVFPCCFKMHRLVCWRHIRVYIALREAPRSTLIVFSLYIRPTWYGQCVKWTLDWLFSETFLHPSSKNIFVWAFWHLEVDFTFFAFNFLLVLILPCTIPQFQASWGKVNFEVHILEYELKVRGILIKVVVGY